jgi:hypothetical protein
MYFGFSPQEYDLNQYSCWPDVVCAMLHEIGHDISPLTMLTPWVPIVFNLG